MKKLIALLAASCMTLASATSLTRDFSDTWYVPTEPGWGVNMNQQGDTLFVTMFVYGPNSQATWYVASDLILEVNGANPRFSGPLYRTTGPFFGTVPFNPNAVTVTRVGSATFTGTSATTGTLAYSVDGVSVTQNVTRQFWRTENIAGEYLGSSIGTYSGCTADNGAFQSIAAITFTQAGNSISINELGAGYNCNYSGTYTQAGRMGQITGSGTCSPNQVTRSFTATDVQVSPESIGMRMVTDASACHFDGRMGGIRR